MTQMTKLQCVVIAGPNGAGKTSSASRLLRDTVGVSAFVNADSLLSARRMVSSDVMVWRMYDASALESPRLIAHRAGDRPLVIDDGPCWDRVVRTLEEAK